MPGKTGEFSIVLDLGRHVASVAGSVTTDVPLASGEFTEALSQALSAHTDIPIEFPESPKDLTYDSAAVRRYGDALKEMVAPFRSLAEGLREETSPLQVWPHHLDLALAWFSGRTVPDTDPDEPDFHRESATVGFSTGDDGIPEAYFYGIAYPFPDGITDTPLPEPAYWHGGGFRGAVHPYVSVAESDRPSETLSRFLTGYHGAVAPLMR
jgi:hypothetical protein